MANIYGPAHDEDKMNFLTEFAKIVSKAKYPLCLGGDFNIIRYCSEKNKHFSNNKFSDMFNIIINTYALRDLPLIGGKFTWSNNRADPTLEKLDKVLISDNWETEFPRCNIRKIPRYMSDHNPIIYNSESNISHKECKCFSFEISWFKHVEFLNKINESGQVK